MSLQTIILAAGASRRMGSPKALLKIGGRTFLEVPIARHRNLNLPVWVVSSEPVYRRLSHLATPGVRHLLNPHPERGPLSSIRIALDRIGSSSGFLLQPVDHPLVSSQTLAALAECHSGEPSKILIPAFKGRKGHPVVFPAGLYNQLREGPLEQGARWVVQNNISSVRLIDVDDDAILANLNTADDLANWGLKKT